MRSFNYLICLLMVGCSLTRGMQREVVITSQPSDADVSYLSDSGQFKLLGKTPLTLDQALINEWNKHNKEYAVLKVSKSGHVVESLFIDLNGRYKIAYNADLKSIDVWNNKDMEISSTVANKLATKVQQINQQVFNKNFDTALRNTEALIEQFPKAHVFYDMKGSILFLMGKKNEALASYQKSLSLNPDNNEAKIMLEKVTGETK